MFSRKRQRQDGCGAQLAALKAGERVGANMSSDKGGAEESPTFPTAAPVGLRRIRAERRWEPLPTEEDREQKLPPKPG